MAPSLYFMYREESRVFQDVSLWQERHLERDGHRRTGGGPGADGDAPAAADSRSAAGVGTRLYRRGRRPEEYAHGDALRRLLEVALWRRSLGNRPPHYGGRRRSRSGGRSAGIVPVHGSQGFPDVSAAVESQRSAPGQFQLAGCCPAQAGRHARAGQRGHRAHAPDGQSEIPGASRLQREDVRSGADRPESAVVEGRPGGRRRQYAVGADGHGGHGVVDCVRQCGESAAGSRRRTATGTGDPRGAGRGLGTDRSRAAAGKRAARHRRRRTRTRPGIWGTAPAGCFEG